MGETKELIINRLLRSGWSVERCIGFKDWRRYWCRLWLSKKGRSSLFSIKLGQFSFEFSDLSFFFIELWTPNVVVDHSSEIGVEFGDPILEMYIHLIKTTAD